MIEFIPPTRAPDGFENSHNVGHRPPQSSQGKKNPIDRLISLIENDRQRSFLARTNLIPEASLMKFATDLQDEASGGNRKQLLEDILEVQAVEAEFSKRYGTTIGDVLKSLREIKRSFGE